MISVWYPTAEEVSKRGSRSLQFAPYLRPNAAAHIDKAGSFGTKPGEVDWRAISTHAVEGAPVRSGRRLPVVLYSPGLGVPRALGSVLVEELASRGYVVVTMDHTYETAPVEFPGGRVEGMKLPASSTEVRKKVMRTRVEDTRFVLDQLAALRQGHNPDAGQRELPADLGTILDLTKIGMFGHSAGGIQSAMTMREDRRIDAGIDMDGTMQYATDDLMPVALEGLKRPFMLMGANTQTHVTTPSWKSFWEKSTGWKRDLNVPKGRHYTFTDVQAFLPSLDDELDISPQFRTANIGTVDPKRIISSQRAYVPAFFDRHLRDLPKPILNGPSRRHPDVKFIR
ncbi:lipase [Nonomuraea sp. B10E15]|uniref:alpha/beta hydrolase family protein n=1 Tax=Nonomuraea sp. B10E15 TaxID=3153560 RepID=UPI00325FDF93